MLNVAQLLSWRPGPAFPSTVDLGMSVPYERSFVAVDGYGLPETMYYFNPDTYQWDLMDQTLAADHYNGMVMMIPDDYWPCDGE